MSPSHQYAALPESATVRSVPTDKVCSGDNQFTFSERIECLKLYGDHSQHFTALQPGIQYFDMSGVGYIGFSVHSGRRIVLGDPVCDQAKNRRLIHTFLAAHPNASFVQVSESVAKILHHEFGFYATMFGQELKVPLKHWSTSGKNRRVLRKAINQAKRQGVTVSESDVPMDVAEISTTWLKTRKATREIGFLIRPENMPYSDGCRYFYAWKDGKPIGFAVFDPAYRDGRIVSYLPNISRGCESFRQGLFYVIMVAAIDQFRREGIQYLDLGLCPLAPCDEVQDCESRMLRNIFRATYRYCFHYNCRGIHFTKQRFGGDWSPAYLCHRNTLPVIDLWRLLRLSRIF